MSGMLSRCVLPNTGCVNVLNFIDMKMTKLFFVAFAVILFACKEDSDPQPVSSQGLVGAWTATAIDYAGVSTTTVMGYSSSAEFYGKAKAMNLTVEFKESPAVVTSSGDYTIELTTKTMGQTFTQDTSFSDFLSNGTWSVDGNTLTVVNGATTEKATIAELTADVLVVEFKTTRDLSNSGAVVKTTFGGTYRFKRK